MQFMNETILVHESPSTIAICVNVTITTLLLIILIIILIILKRAKKENVIRLIPLLSVRRSILTKGDQLPSPRLCNCIVFHFWVIFLKFGYNSIFFSFWRNLSSKHCLSTFSIIVVVIITFKANSGRFSAFQIFSQPQSYAPNPCSKRGWLVMTLPEKNLRVAL